MFLLLFMLPCCFECTERTFNQMVAVKKKLTHTRIIFLWGCPPIALITTHKPSFFRNFISKSSNFILKVSSAQDNTDLKGWRKFISWRKFHALSMLKCHCFDSNWGGAVLGVRLLYRANKPSWVTRNSHERVDGIFTNIQESSCKFQGNFQVKFQIRRFFFLLINRR